MGSYVPKPAAWFLPLLAALGTSSTNYKYKQLVVYRLAPIPHESEFGAVLTVAGPAVVVPGYGGVSEP